MAPTYGQIHAAARAVGEAFDEAAERVADWSDRVVLAHHEPVRIEDAAGRPTGEVLCSAHREWTDWPCADVVRATDRRAARLRANESAPPQPEG